MTTAPTTRTTELIGMDEDGRMYLWDTGEVRPITAFESDADGLIKHGHYVIQWKGHAITVHCGMALVRGVWRISVQFMCSDAPVLYMSRAEVEPMLLGEVIPDPELEAQILRELKAWGEAIDAAHRAPHRRRGRI
jgi:hypothetical protein